MKTIRWLLAPAAGLALAFAFACGGDKDKDGGDAASSGDLPAGREVNLITVANQIDTLQSFRFDIAMKFDLGDLATSEDGEDPLGEALGTALLGLLGDIKAKGAFVGPDSMEVEMTMMGQEIATVQIGDRAWVKVFGEWEETEPQDLTVASPSQLLTDLLPDEVLKGAKVSKEKVNGVEATRYSFNKESLVALAEAMGESTAEFAEVSKANVDIWLNADGVPVKLVLDMVGKDESGQEVGIEMEMNIRDINSKSIKIEAPV